MMIMMTIYRWRHTDWYDSIICSSTQSIVELELSSTFELSYKLRLTYLQVCFPNVYVPVKHLIFDQAFDIQTVNKKNYYSFYAFFLSQKHRNIVYAVIMIQLKNYV